MGLSPNRRREMRKAFDESTGPGLMDTREIMALAMKLARQSRTPADSEIYVPTPNAHRALFGIDADVGMLLAAKDLGYDLVIAHHPLGGKASLGILKVYERHATNLEAVGVSKKDAMAAVRDMQEEHAPRVHAMNYDHVPSLARLLGIPLMSIHNPCDEIGRRVMEETLGKGASRASTVGDGVAALELLPEFARAETKISIRMGKEGNALGRWVVLHGAGTNGGYHIAKCAFDHGIDTVVYIHVDPGHLGHLRSEFGGRGPKNLIVTGHVASDSIGINVLIRAMRDKGLEVKAVSGIVEP